MSRAMKDSGIPWIGEIPCHWEIQRLQTQLYELNEKNTPIKTDYVLSLTNTRGVIPYTEKGDVGNKAKENHEEYKIAYPNTIVANSMNILIGSVGICNYYGCVSPVYYILKERSGTDLRFYNYVLSCVPFQKHLKQYANGILEIRLRLSCKDILQRRVPTPSYLEQQSIADFLDKKCGEIDEMVSLQEKIVEELKAYKQAVITEAVCKGLNPDVPMKDSGIEWVDSIPRHWEEVRFYKVNYIRGRLGWKGLKAEEYTETGYPFLSAFNIINDKISWEDLNFINQERYDESPEIKLSIGDVLVVKDGAGIGKCARLDSLPLGEATVNSSLAVITPNERMFYAFQYYYMLSTPFQHIIWLLKIGMGVPHLTQENMHDIIETCPPMEEQRAIVDYLDTKCAEIDTLISVRQAKIDALKEYKKSIIYEYITGKKEVPT